MTITTILLFALLGAFLGLDVVSFPQAMFSRPIVASTLAGTLGGSASDGLLAGVFLEMMALETLPVGASRYPEWGTASVVGGALYVTRHGDATSALLFAMLGAMITAWVGGWSMYALRRLNGRWTKRALPALERGNASVVTWLQMRGLGADCVRSFVLTALALALPRATHGLRDRKRPRRFRENTRGARRGGGIDRGERRVEALARLPPRPMVLPRRARARLRDAAARPDGYSCGYSRHASAPVPHGAFASSCACSRVQASWNYETMLGTGHRLLCRARVARAPRRPRGASSTIEALARESHYFNAHPYLAAVAVGALARVELDGTMPPAQIERFRIALCGPARQRRRSAGVGRLAAVHRARRAARLWTRRRTRPRGHALSRAVQRGARRRSACGGFAPAGARQARSGLARHADSPAGPRISRARRHGPCAASRFRSHPRAFSVIRTCRSPRPRANRSSARTRSCFCCSPSLRFSESRS